jgi:hypothetical protein
MLNSKKIQTAFVLFSFFLNGCCFDLTRVEQVEVQLNIADQEKPSFVLEESADIPLKSWSTTHLNANTIWTYVGTIDQGDVYKSKDQTVTVWGSNLYEAYPVIKENMLYGFYLPVEKTFTAIKKPTVIKINFTNSNH